MNSRTSIRDVLYETPGPKARRRIAVGTVISLIVIAGLLFLVIRSFYLHGQLDSKLWFFFGQITTWTFLGEGLIGTLEAAAGAAVITFALGMVMMMGRLSDQRIIRGIAVVFVQFTRGVPTLLFVYFFFLVLPGLGITMSAYWKICIPVAISASGVVAEVLRSGVNAVPKGQSEAAMSLGMRKWKLFFKIVFPQAMRYVIPALISELVIVVKDTTFAYVVSFADLMQNAKVLISNYDSMLPVYLVIAIIYIIINYLINKLSVKIGNLERKKTNLEGVTGIYGNIAE